MAAAGGRSVSPDGGHQSLSPHSSSLLCLHHCSRGTQWVKLRGQHSKPTYRRMYGDCLLSAAQPATMAGIADSGGQRWTVDTTQTVQRAGLSCCCAIMSTCWTSLAESRSGYSHSDAQWDNVELSQWTMSILNRNCKLQPAILPIFEARTAQHIPAHYGTHTK